MKICFRIDANSFVGLGHLKRCLQLAINLKNKIDKCKIYFILQKDKEAYESIIKKSGFKVYLIKKNYDDYEQTKKILFLLNCKYLILDHYYLGLNWEKKIRYHLKKLFIISDKYRKNYANLLILQNYENEIKNKNLLSGKKYYLIDNEYKIYRKKKNNKRIPKKLTLLINFGSYDINNLTCKTIVYFFKNYKDIKIFVVIDKSFKYKKQLNNLKKNEKNLQVFSGLKSLAFITNKASICVGSGGIHNYERLYLGKLSYVIRTDKNQKKNIDFLKKKKLIVFLGNLNKFSFNKINNKHFRKKFLLRIQKKLFKFFPSNKKDYLSSYIKKKIYE